MFSSGLAFNSIHFLMGEPYLLHGFVVVILGGLGSISGALLAGLLFGMIQTLTVAYMPSGLTDIISLLDIVPDPARPAERPAGTGRRRFDAGGAVIDFFSPTEPLFDLFLLHPGFAFSQYVVLRAGVFSVATAGFAAIGAYYAAILGVRHGWPHPGRDPALARLPVRRSALFLSWPLARLRGVYQAIATLAFVEIVVSLKSTRRA